jgi:hypothetical protein
MKRPILAIALLLTVVVAETARAGSEASPTFSKDVAPILWKNCAGCHRPGEVGPFSLLTYKDAAKRAEFLQEVTETRQMPPWKPEQGFGEFHDARRLSDLELKTIADWAKAGTPEGDPKDLPPAPRFAEGWQLGTPDLVLKMPQEFKVPASGKDIQRCFVIPIPTEGDRTVASVEFRPGNRRVVHHAILYLDSSGAALKKDQADPEPGYSSFGGPGFIPTGALGGWAPGAMPRPLPEGTGKYLRGGSSLVLQVHYHPDGKAEVDQSVVGITFTKSPAKKIVAGIVVRSREIKIPIGEARHQIEAESEPLPVDVDAIGITPHMHNVGREFKVVAESPDGKTIPLIWIKDWDFNWQGQYQYKTPIRLAKGTIIKVDAYYDNSPSNPKRPMPPQVITWGEQTTNEMCLLSVQVVTDSVADLRKVTAMNLGRLGALLAGATTKAARPKAAMTNPEGFLIPERLKQQLTRFDKDNNGRLSPAEVDAMPEPLKQRVKQVIENRP